MKVANPDGGGGDAPAYQIIGVSSTYRVNANNTTTPIVQITARSVLYDVAFTFNVTRATFDGQGAPPLVSLRTAQVNQLAAHEHVVAVHGEEDQGPDGSLYNYLVVTVGTDDGEVTTDVRIRMDQIGLPSAFGAVDHAWALLTGLGPR